MLDDFFRQVADSMLDHDTAVQVAEQERALAQNPDWAEGHYHLAQLLRVQHKRDDAKLHLLTALEKKPSLADAHIALGEIYLAENDLPRAKQHANYAAQFGNARLLEQMKRNGNEEVRAKK
jgi:cytochrome c-type biogenesis protein CcmH/NrfG